KGIGGITPLGDELVETSNLNRPRFFIKKVGRNKDRAHAENLVPECIVETQIQGIPLRLEEAIASDVDLSCAVAIVGVDNNPALVAATRYFRATPVPVIFVAVSVTGDHGYIFVQAKDGPCLGCLFPDMAADDRYPCPGTPAIADILQGVGSLAVYAVDTLVMNRTRFCNYRRLSLSDCTLDGGSQIPVRIGCEMVGPNPNSNDSHRV